MEYEKTDLATRNTLWAAHWHFGIYCFAWRWFFFMIYTIYFEIPDNVLRLSARQFSFTICFGRFPRIAASKYSIVAAIQVDYEKTKAPQDIHSIPIFSASSSFARVMMSRTQFHRRTSRTNQDLVTPNLLLSGKPCTAY